MGTATGSSAKATRSGGNPHASLPNIHAVGNEAWGLPPDLVALADEPVAVPIYGQAESLNLAAAAAVCLYASARAQRVHTVTGQAGT